MHSILVIRYPNAKLLRSVVVHYSHNKSTVGND